MAFLANGVPDYLRVKVYIYLLPHCCAGAQYLYLLVNRAIIYIVVRHGQKSFFSSKVEQWQISHKKKQRVYDSLHTPIGAHSARRKGRESD